METITYTFKEGDAVKIEGLEYEQKETIFNKMLKDGRPEWEEMGTTLTRTCTGRQRVPTSIIRILVASEVLVNLGTISRGKTLQNLLKLHPKEKNQQHTLEVISTLSIRSLIKLNLGVIYTVGGERYQIALT